MLGSVSVMLAAVALVAGVGGPVAVPASTSAGGATIETLAPSAAARPTGAEDMLVPDAPTGGGARGTARGDAPGGGGRVAAAPAPLLGRLGRLDAPRISQYVAGHQAAVGRLIADPPAATAVTSYWSGLDPAARVALENGAPRLVGNLDGIPYTVRARANRVDLSQTIAETTKRIDAYVEGRGVLLRLNARLRTLERVRTAVTASKGGPPRSLVILDVREDSVRAAVVVGDLSTARFVSYLVPGMFFSVDQQLVDWTRTAEDLYRGQERWLRRSFGCRACAGAPSVATIAWIGYRTPALFDIGGRASARQGADYLEDALSGIRSVRAGDEPYLTVVAHSYGTTAALMALARRTVHVDALAIVGSPGSAAQSATDLDVTPGHVFVGDAGLDPVANTAFFGSDPSQPGYGARAFGVSGERDPFGGARLTASTGHNGYFAPGSESLRNLALISVGRGALVSPPSHAE